MAGFDFGMRKTLYGSEYPTLVYSHSNDFFWHLEQGFWESHFSLEAAHSLHAVLDRDGLIVEVEPESCSLS